MPDRRLVTFHCSVISPKAFVKARWLNTSICSVPASDSLRLPLKARIVLTYIAIAQLQMSVSSFVEVLCRMDVLDICNCILALFQWLFNKISITILCYCDLIHLNNSQNVNSNSLVSKWNIFCTTSVIILFTIHKLKKAFSVIYIHIIFRKNE